MESWENKIWGDKLNSLQDLPNGYTPNLSAKWEIVEASLPTTNKRRLVPMFIRWSVAAAVLLSVGLVWVNTGKKDAADLVVKEQIVMPTVVFQKKQSVENETFTTDAHPAHTSQPPHPTTTKKAKPAGELAYQAPSKTATIPVRGDTNRGRLDGAETTMNTFLPTVDSISYKSTWQNTVATTIEENPRPAKKKIYQRDFNDGVLVMDTGFAPASRQHFSIQLSPFNRKADNSEPPAHRLQLKQAL